MPNDTKNDKKIFASRQQVTAALERAAKRARVIAEQTGTQLIVSQTPVQPLINEKLAASPRGASVSS